MTDVMEYTFVNKVIKEVLDTGPGVARKMDSKFRNRRTIQELLETLILEEVPAEVSRKERIRNQEAKRKEWAERWAALDRDLVTEMDILMSLENAKMDIDVQKEVFIEILEDIEMEEEEYEDWLLKELSEMGIKWTPGLEEPMEESVAELGSIEYPLCHGGVCVEPQELPTITEKGVEIVPVESVHTPQEGLACVTAHALGTGPGRDEQLEWTQSMGEPMEESVAELGSKEYPFYEI